MSLEDILKTLGTIFILSSVLMSRLYAAYDDDIDKHDFINGKYLTKYPVFIILFIVGVILLVLGFLL